MPWNHAVCSGRSAFARARQRSRDTRGAGDGLVARVRRVARMRFTSSRISTFRRQDSAAVGTVRSTASFSDRPRRLRSSLTAPL